MQWTFRLLPLQTLLPQCSYRLLLHFIIFFFCFAFCFSSLKVQPSRSTHVIFAGLLKRTFIMHLTLLSTAILPLPSPCDMAMHSLAISHHLPFAICDPPSLNFHIVCQRSHRIQIPISIPIPIPSSSSSSSGDIIAATFRPTRVCSLHANALRAGRVKRKSVESSSRERERSCSTHTHTLINTHADIAAVQSHCTKVRGQL